MLVLILALAPLNASGADGSEPSLAAVDLTEQGAELTSEVVQAISLNSEFCEVPSRHSGFVDVQGNAHEASIACLAAWSVTNGFTDGTFRPQASVTRAQLATATYQLLRVLGADPLEAAPRFSDVGNDHAHAQAIGALAGAGILQGVAPNQFGADASMTRGQLASMLANAHQAIFGVSLPTDAALSFADSVGTTHEAGVIQLATVGIVTGQKDGRFGPADPVSRGQMASFLGRYTALLLEEGHVEVPEHASPTTRRSELGGPLGEFASGRHFGVATPSNGWSDSELDDVAKVAGQQPGIVLHYLGFGDELHREQLSAVRANGATSLLTWEPFDWEAGTTDQSQFRLRRIIDGEFDAYLRRTAETLKAFDAPVMLRFAHEMNGDWYPWSEQTNGNSPGEYVAAWRHVHDVFARSGVENVAWVWSPNVVYEGSQPLAEVYPGDAYVDAIAVDGYNWGTTTPTSTWQTPSEVFDPTLREVRRLAPGMPLMIGETGSADEGGDKAAWVVQLFDWLERNPDVRVLVWFHIDKEADWRIDSSQEAGQAFFRGLSAWSSMS